MESVDKKHWWQKKSAWVLASGIFAAVAAVPALPAIVVTVATVGAVVTGSIAAYGFVEVARSNAKTSREIAQAIRNSK